MSLSDCEKCWETPCTCGHEWEKYSLEYLLAFRKMLDTVINKKTSINSLNTSDEWVCRITVTNYDDDWSFRNRTTKERLSEGSSVLFSGKTALDALKAFTDVYSVEGYHLVFGDNIPSGYGHVTYIRSIMSEYISNVNAGILDNLNIMGNYDVEIVLEPKCSRCKGPTTQESICDDCISKLKYDSMR